MLTLIAETHSHTVATSHAYSTLYENICWCRDHGIKFLCSTEHGPALPDAPHCWYFNNMRVIPDLVDGVVVLRGVEANIMDEQGGLDLPDDALARLDWVIAACHTPVLSPCTMDPESMTAAWLNIVANPNVDVLGHPEDSRFPFDFDRVVRECAHTGTIVEINNNSPVARAGSEENCFKIGRACARYGVRVALGSDAHFFSHIGGHEWSDVVVRECGIPEELIVNADYDRFLALAREKSGRRLKED